MEGELANPIWGADIDAAGVEGLTAVVMDTGAGTGARLGDGAVVGGVAACVSSASQSRRQLNCIVGEAQFR
ncbi:protein of unknown function [Pararobbsia alpina]